MRRLRQGCRPTGPRPRRPFAGWLGRGGLAGSPLPRSGRRPATPALVGRVGVGWNRPKEPGPAQRQAPGGLLRDMVPCQGEVWGWHAGLDGVGTTKSDGYDRTGLNLVA